MGNKITITRRRPAIDERYTRPQGLYPCRDVDQRKLRRLILDSKLAPCYPGAEEVDKDLEECPICFLQYPSLNRSKCCAKGICTECFLQMKAPHAARPTQCPFCKTPCYAVEYRGAKTLEEKGMEQAEEQKVIEAKIRMRQQELQDDEEREQRREQDMIRLQTSRALLNTNHLTAIAPIDDMEGVNWRSGWGSVDHQPQVLEASALEERNTSGMVPHVQQSTLSISSNIIPPVTQQQAQTDFSTPQFPPGAPRAQHREDEFDLDLEDIMVMEAIWLSIQEQGARHRRSNAEPIQARHAESLTEISLDSESDDEPANLPPPLHPVPEAEPWEPQGTLVGAIAALAEQQAVDGDSIMPAASQPTFPSSRAREEALENTLGNEPERYARVGDQSSSGESSGGVKGSFEEQMVLAMALSIADAQTRVHQGDTRSGPLLQPAPHTRH